MRSRGLLITSTLLAAVALFSSCQRNQATPPEAHGPLPAPPSGELKFAGAAPVHPFAKQVGNYFARTVFETDGPKNSRIEVREVLIPPQTKSAVEALPGPAIIDAALGEVTVSIGDKPEKLASGAIRALEGGQALQLENTDSRPAMVRLYVIRAR